MEQIGGWTNGCARPHAQRRTHGRRKIADAAPGGKETIEGTQYERSGGTKKRMHGRKDLKRSAWNVDERKKNPKRPQKDRKQTLSQEERGKKVRFVRCG